MGWNSWDCYGASVTEKELRQNIDYMAGHLRDNGRLMPAPNRFPSAANGKGFKEIADYTHSKGLKFGIHIMRGIPRQAVAQNVKIKDSKYTAREAAHPSSICCWNTDMYGLDTTKPGAQDYYDSILELYASWGVDFIKVDDICVKYGRPGDESTLKYGGDEIEMLRNAIDKCGRPIVLSLSPGPAMVEQAGHLCKHANMCRRDVILIAICFRLGIFLSGAVSMD